MNKKTSLWQKLLLSPHLAWCAIFIVVPLVFVLYYTFTTADGALTLDNIRYLGTPKVLQCFGVSIGYAAAATAICLVVAYPMALVISRLTERRRNLATKLIMLPMWVSFIIRTYTIKNIFEDNGIINRILGTNIAFTGSSALIIFGMVYDFLPYMIMPICSVLCGIDDRYFEAAQDLGCNAFQTFYKVTLPLSLSGIISGITMVFVPAVSTFYISSTLSNGRIVLVGDKIESAFLMENNFNRGSALSFVLMIMILICTVVMNRFGDKEQGVTI